VPTVPSVTTRVYARRSSTVAGRLPSALNQETAPATLVRVSASWLSVSRTV
jgi:hypothetical protein